MPNQYTKNPLLSNDMFWRRLDRSGDCWEWQMRCNPQGYGKTSYLGRSGQLAHRVAWQRAFGAIPEGMEVCHTCDNPPCCNPAHLFLGTALDNNQDKARKGRARNGWQTRPTEMQQRVRPRDQWGRIEAWMVPQIFAQHLLGISQKAIGEHFGVRQTTVSNVLTGKHSLTKGLVF